ncbi:hypothetical protein FACS1894184_20060 [Clostridia bacterium]|nr:hypothetical protein FACS1894184_20060 [Clostridia bacterium]
MSYALSTNLRTIRKAQGLTQVIFADLMGISTYSLSQYELGNSSPSAFRAFEIATSLDVSLNELFYDVSPINKITTYGSLARVIVGTRDFDVKYHGQSKPLLNFIDFHEINNARLLNGHIDIDIHTLLLKNELSNLDKIPILHLNI